MKINQKYFWVTVTLLLSPSFVQASQNLLTAALIKVGLKSAPAVTDVPRLTQLDRIKNIENMVKPQSLWKTAGMWAAQSIVETIFANRTQLTIDKYYPEKAEGARLDKVYESIKKNEANVNSFPATIIEPLRKKLAETPKDFPEYDRLAEQLRMVEEQHTTMQSQLTRQKKQYSSDVDAHQKKYCKQEPQGQQEAAKKG